MSGNFNPPARISNNSPVVSSSQVGSYSAVNSGTGERRNGGSSSEPPYDAHIEQSKAETPRGSGAMRTYRSERERIRQEMRDEVCEIQ